MSPRSNVPYYNSKIILLIFFFQDERLVSAGRNYTRAVPTNIGFCITSSDEFIIPLWTRDYGELMQNNCGRKKKKTGTIEFRT